MGECVRVPGASWCFGGGGGARLVLIWSVLDRVGPVGCRLSGCCGAVGGEGWMHSSTLAAIKAQSLGRAAF